MVSHKTSFHQNIPSLDSDLIKGEIRRLERNTRAEKKVRFDEDRYRYELSKSLSPDRVEKVVERAYKPCAPMNPNKKSPTAADLHRAERKRVKKALRSRRR